MWLFLVNVVFASGLQAEDVEQMDTPPAVVAAHQAVLAQRLVGDERLDATTLSVTAPDLLARLQTHQLESASCADVLILDGQLHVSQLGLSAAPPMSLDPAQAWAFTDLLREKVYPGFFEMRTEAILKLDELVAADVCTAQARIVRANVTDHALSLVGSSGPPALRVP